MAACLYLPSFHPLVAGRLGSQASERFGLPPFIDGSIRREPDLQHPHPAITCLCRAGKFAPRLQPGDYIAYLTVKGRYGAALRHHRLVAVLVAEQLFESHDMAAAWYRGKRMPLPNNLMVEGNASMPLDRSHRRNQHRDLPDDEWRRKWDLGYRARARAHGRVVGCTPLWVNTTWSAPVVSDELLISVFGRVPGTRNPGAHDLSRLRVLCKRLGIVTERP